MVYLLHNKNIFNKNELRLGVDDFRKKYENKIGKGV